MSGKERRISPRKNCAVPLRFRVLSNGTRVIYRESEPPVEVNIAPVAAPGILEGESVNLSERGLYFRSRERLTIGAPLEIYFRLPQELTGRAAEDVRCSARVVHIDQAADGKGLHGIGATVERFEPLARIRDWHN